MATDTVYGIVARASDEKAVKRFYALKQREYKPGTVIAASIEQIIKLGITANELQKAAYFWPNPVSIILTAPDTLDYLSQGVKSLAFRIPADHKLREFLEQTGPLVTSSANLPGQPPATTIKEAINYFNDEVDFYVDGDKIINATPSTIIRIEGDRIEVIRDGAYKLNTLLT